MFTQRHFFVPELCRNSVVLMIAVICLLLSTSISLAIFGRFFLDHLGLILLYLNWLVLSSIALLCFVRPYLNKQPYWRGLIYAVLICLLCFSVTELSSQAFMYSYRGLDVWAFITRFVATLFMSITVIASFSWSEAIRRSGRAESEARVKALQMRINPHFLFNTLNTIAELIHVSADKAESSIESLGMLFRAALENDNTFHSLKQEIALCERYLMLEKTRLGSRLQLNWHILVASPQDYAVPKLLLQPIIENSVFHGAEESGLINVDIDIKETAKLLSIMVSNGFDEQAPHKHGHGIALENVKERLYVLFDDKQTVRITKSERQHHVLLSFPKLKLHSLTSSNHSVSKRHP